MNGLEKPFRINPIRKIEKAIKIKVKLPHVNKKTASEKANFFSNICSDSYFEIRVKQIKAAKPPGFSINFPFQRAQNHNSNLISEMIKKKSEEILKH